MKFLIVSLLILAVAYTENSKEWEQYKFEHKKSYEKDHEHQKKESLKKNEKKVEEHNAKYKKGEVGYKVKVNHFSDMDSEDVSEKINKFGNGLILPGASDHMTIWDPPGNDTKIPDSKNWVSEGAVTSVKNQGYCGSGWAFSAVGSLEGQHFLKTGKLTELSVQNLLDCVWTNYACSGGYLSNAFQYIWYNGGIDTHEYYPYTSQVGMCKFNPLFSGSGCTGMVTLASGDEEQLKMAVATVGPVSVAIDASKWSFLHYSDGIYDDPTCNSTDLNHAVLVVGYGQENNQDYWLVKNSWGVVWGEKGYVKISRNKDNQCGIASKPSFPLV